MLALMHNFIGQNLQPLNAFIKYVDNMLIYDFGWLVGFGFNGPLRQYFSLYRAVSQREGERGKKG